MIIVDLRKHSQGRAGVRVAFLMLAMAGSIYFSCGSASAQEGLKRINNCGLEPLNSKIQWLQCVQEFDLAALRIAIDARAISSEYRICAEERINFLEDHLARLERGDESGRFGQSCFRELRYDTAQVVILLMKSCPNGVWTEENKGRPSCLGQVSADTIRTVSVPAINRRPSVDSIESVHLADEIPRPQPPDPVQLELLPEILVTEFEPELFVEIKETIQAMEPIAMVESFQIQNAGKIKLAYPDSIIQGREVSLVGDWPEATPEIVVPAKQDLELQFGLVLQVVPLPRSRSQPDTVLAQIRQRRPIDPTQPMNSPISNKSSEKRMVASGAYYQIGGAVGAFNNGLTGQDYIGIGENLELGYAFHPSFGAFIYGSQLHFNSSDVEQVTNFGAGINIIPVISELTSASFSFGLSVLDGKFTGSADELNGSHLGASLGAGLLRLVSSSVGFTIDLSFDFWRIVDKEITSSSTEDTDVTVDVSQPNRALTARLTAGLSWFPDGRYRCNGGRCN